MSRASRAKGYTAPVVVDEDEIVPGTFEEVCNECGIQNIAEEIVHKEIDGIEKPFKLKDDPDLANRITNAIVKQLGLLPKKSETENKSFNFYYAVQATIIEKGEASAELSLSCYYNDQKDGTLKIKVDHPFLNVIVYIVGFQFAEPEK